MNDQRPGVHFTHPWRLALATIVVDGALLVMGYALWRWLT